MALCGALSGFPAAVAAASEVAGCADCDAPLEVGRCPPNCDLGPCGKVLPTLASRWSGLAQPLPARAPLAVEAASPVLTPVERGVFHPPRR